MSSNLLPLDGLLVVDLSQFLAGPYASLRLHDLGARVVKIERPDCGDLARDLYLFDAKSDAPATNFHAINRGKESLALNLKDAGDLASLKKLIAVADVVIQNFRPGVIERLGLSYQEVKKIKPDIVYASISGYGPDGPWADFPGQDLLAQARSGVMWLNGHAEDGPVPFGLAIADMFAGANIAHGILAALVGRGIRAEGCHVETSLLESMIDFQFEVLAAHLNDGGKPPIKSVFRNAHVGLSAPYGVYPTQDGYIAIAMTPIGQLGELLGIEGLLAFAEDKEDWFTKRDEIKSILGAKLVRENTQHWMHILQPHDIWCAEVLNWPRLLESEAFKRLDMVQVLDAAQRGPLQLMRSPIRFDGIRSKSKTAAPVVGEHSAELRDEFDL